MKCPYLEQGKVVSLCFASVNFIMPEEDDLKEYCKTEEHYRCPMLLSHVLRGGAENELPPAA